MIKLRAFSLIELMVVIAVIAILATVAAPAYKQYVFKSQLNQAKEYIQTVANQAKILYSTKGVVPTIAEIGLTPNPGNPYRTIDPTDPDDYLAPMVAYIQLQSSPMPRCNQMIVTGVLSNFVEGDYYPNSGSVAPIYFRIVEIDGVMNQFCMYDPGAESRNFMLSNCANPVLNSAGYAADVNYINAHCN